MKEFIKTFAQTFGMISGLVIGIVGYAFGIIYIVKHFGLLGVVFIGIFTFSLFVT
jgi:hypothetical protein